MSSPPPALKQRGGSSKRATTPVPDSKKSVEDYLDTVQQKTKSAITDQWDYKVALAVITVLAFITRFYGITHPNQVVFDEVHFGKVSTEYTRLALERPRRMLTSY